MLVLERIHSEALARPDRGGDLRHEGVRSIGFPAAVVAEASDGAPIAPPRVHAPSGGHIMLASATTGRYKKILVTTTGGEATRQAQLEMWQSAAESVSEMGEHMVFNYLNFGLWTAGGYSGPLMAWTAGATAITD